MKKEITANGNTAVITTDEPMMEQTIVIEPEPLSSVSFMGVDVQTGSVWAGLVVVLVLVVLTKKILKK
jgi:hypothetical protein